MNTSRPTKIQKSRAQAAVEFALVLPLLLLLLYGLLEMGRLLFIYGSTITAARQAARYGSATGTNAGGTPYYNDCAGIEAAARKTGFINVFDTVDISYDGGFYKATDTVPPPSVVGDPKPLDPDPPCGSFDPDDGDRIIVAVTTQWQPIVSIVPLTAWTIKSQSERSILLPVSIDTSAGILQLFVTSTPANNGTYDIEGDDITLTFSLKNIGTADLNGPFTVTTTIGDTPTVYITDCESITTALEPDATLLCSATSVLYEVLQTDMDAGTITSTSVAEGGGSDPSAVILTFNVDADPSISLTVTPNTPVASTAGTPITYTYAIENTGDVSLTGPFTVTYTITGYGLATVTCPSPTPPWTPTSPDIICTSDYTISAADITREWVDNTANAHAVYPPSAPVDSAPAVTARVVTLPFLLVIVPSSTAPTLGDPNQVITFKYRAYNNTTSAVSFSISTSTQTSPSTGTTAITISCPTSTIPASSYVECSYTRSVTLAEFNAGGSISTAATATSGSNTSSATGSISISQLLAMSAVINVSGTPNSDGAYPQGTVLTYTYDLTNTGNVTLIQPFTISDSKFTFTCSTTSLNPSVFFPGAIKTCAATPATYTVSAADDLAGSITNSGTASAAFGAQTVQATATKTVVTYIGSRIALTVTPTPTSRSSPDPVVFSYRITNTGSVALSGLSLTSSLGAVDCGTWNGDLAVFAYKNCSSTYSVTSSADVTNNASATNGSVSANASVVVPIFYCSTTNLTLTGPTYISTLTPQWTLTNNTGTPLTITSVSFQWQAGNGNCNNSAICLTKYSLGIDTISSAENKTGSVNNSSSPLPLTLPTGSTGFEMNFNKVGFNASPFSNLAFTFSEYSTALGHTECKLPH